MENRPFCWATLLLIALAFAGLSVRQAGAQITALPVKEFKKVSFEAANIKGSPLSSATIQRLGREDQDTLGAVSMRVVVTDSISWNYANLSVTIRKNGRVKSQNIDSVRTDAELWLPTADLDNCLDSLFSVVLNDSLGVGDEFTVKLKPDADELTLTILSFDSTLVAAGDTVYSEAVSGNYGDINLYLDAYAPTGTAAVCGIYSQAKLVGCSWAGSADEPDDRASALRDSINLPKSWPAWIKYSMPPADSVRLMFIGVANTSGLVLESVKVKTVDP
ncbi:MAG: hypothetical protein U9N45_00135 [Gemmatimonadota bacterium]|nr:hypothetical protein [Gemmatimonadota bacterium]